MNGRGDLPALLFSAEGRLSRTPFLAAAILLIVMAALYEAIVGTTLHWLTGWMVYPALIYCGACVLSKRLHDRGRSGWWAALILVAMVAVWPRPIGFFDFLLALVLIWAVVELGVMSGEAGANRYGPSPLRPAPA
ncbi:DUF805 domain-containing protein [Phenylobacterium sp.]|uniref:DUF805 domain-containing protein n=1 Tax=Phenylobacterium sp. TaxID=1871053 RepID=UPI002F426533